MNTGMPNKYRYTYNTWVEQGEMEWTRRGTLKPAPTPALIGLISEWAALWPDLSEIYCSYIFSPCEFVDHNYSLFSRLLIARSFWNNLKMTLTLHNSVRSVRLLYTPHNTRHKTHLSIALEICSWKLHFIILTIRDLWLISSINVCNYIHCTSDELLCN